MLPLSYAEAKSRHPDLVGQVLAKLAQSKRDVDPAEVSWYQVDCHDDPDELLDEGAIADVLMTGKMPCRIGVCGKIAGHFGCFCHLKMVDYDKVH
jgi:hypothetical protein